MVSRGRYLERFWLQHETVGVNKPFFLNTFYVFRGNVSKRWKIFTVRVEVFAPSVLGVSFMRCKCLFLKEPFFAFPVLKVGPREH